MGFWRCTAIPTSFDSCATIRRSRPNAVEELLRYDSSVQVTGRTTLEDVDEIGGIALAKGQSVVCLLGSANRDPAVYADPDRLDITRADVRPLSFGGGIHYCVGAQLARIEGEIAIATLLRRLPNLRLDDLEHPDWRQTFRLARPQQAAGELVRLVSARLRVTRPRSRSWPGL